MKKSEFIKYLRDGGKIQMVEFEGGKPNDKLSEIRKAIKVQTNGVKFEGGSWLHFNQIDAKTISQDGDIVDIGWCKYKLIK